MAFSIFSGLKGYQKFAVSMTFALVVAVSIYVILFNLISFDGAFNTQAAINLYQEGTLELDYRPNNTLQTLLPFQIVNGFFLTIFGKTFLATNLANIFFYFLLFGLFIFISCTCKSALPMLAFSCISLSPAFLKYGFGGFGEVPALTYGLLGVSVLVFRGDSYVASILSGMLIAFAITTKWVLFLILPPVLLALFLLKLDKKKLLLFLAATLCTFIIVSYFQFSHFEPGEMEKLFRALVKQNTPHHGSEHFPQQVHNFKTFGLRISKIWEAYSLMSFGFFAPIKIGFAFLLFFMTINIFINHRGRLKSIDIFFIFLSSFLFVYLFWAFALNSRWPERRMLNPDVLLYLTIGLLPYVARFGKIGEIAILGFLAIFFSIHSLFFFSYIKHDRSCNLINFESQMRKGLKLLPEDYNAYGQGHLEAPHWSFLAGKEFKDLLRDSVFYDCIENECNSYIFLQPSNPINKPQLDFVHEIFKLNNIYEFRGFNISRIEGFNNHDKKYVELLDFAKETAINSIVYIHERTRDKMFSPPNFEFNEMAVFLDNKRGLPVIEIGFAAHECQDGKNLRIALVNNSGKYIQNFLVSQGDNKIDITLPKEFRGSKIDIYLLIEKFLRNKALHCTTRNINRIPLEYKIIQLVAKPTKLKK